ncbi:MFS transporter [Microbacterium dauci]|uniref:MFS transporter n=1 Tax=Microbacterium dauci TaxID=3048008 RepID=A0ABT6ZFG9_9MICO|nr:MFS transporter [Microbacterium sp. LX3-4]MDJ1114910.1 MFS transporter [Microbacterium sp. LX3-4]
MTAIHTPSTQSAAPTAPQKTTKNGRRALYGAMFGFYADMYDIYLPVVALAPAMVFFLPNASSAIDTALFAAAIFTASIIGRPLGSLIFGPLGDRVGRRKATLIAAAGSAVCTGIMCVMPGYAQIGMAALVMLVVLRLFDGIFLGGEYTAANPLAMEHAPARLRGVFGSLINMGFPLALVSITLLTMGTLVVFPQGDAESAYAVWGWRVPFFVGFILCSTLFVIYWKSVPESDLWASEQKADNVYRSLLSREMLPTLLLACVTVTGIWFSMNGTIGVFASHFRGLGVATEQVNATMLTAASIAAVLFPVVGYLSQRVGRRTVIIGIGALITVVSAGGFAVAIGNPSTPLMSVAAGAAIVCAFLIWATITAYLIELFPTRIRATGYGVAYALPSLIPAFYANYMVGLGGIMPFEYTPAVIVALGGVLIVVGAMFAKDRRSDNLATV